MLEPLNKVGGVREKLFLLSVAQTEAEEFSTLLGIARYDSHHDIIVLPSGAQYRVRWEASEALKRLQERGEWFEAKAREAVGI